MKIFKNFFFGGEGEIIVFFPHSFKVKAGSLFSFDLILQVLEILFIVCISPILLKFNINHQLLLKNL